jgi:hypothetical protein
MASNEEDDDESLWSNSYHEPNENRYNDGYYHEDDEESDDDDEDDDDDDDEEDIEYTLRGFRLFMNRIEGHETDPADLTFEEDVSPPTVEYISERLVEKNISLEELVKSHLSNHRDYADNHTYDKIHNSTWEMIDGIIQQYKKDVVAMNL